MNQNSSENASKLKLKKILVSLILFAFVIGIPILRILGQKNIGNPYVDFLNVLFEFVVAFSFGYIIYKIFKDVKLTGNLKTDLVKLFFIAILYWILSSYLSLNISSSFNNLPINLKNIELSYYIIPSFSISFLFLFRIFDSVEKPFHLIIVEINPSEISDILKDIIIGALILTITTNVFLGGGVYALSNILGFLNVPTLILSLLFSIIITFIEFSIFYIRKYFSEEIKQILGEFFSKSFLKAFVIYVILFGGLSAYLIYIMYQPAGPYNHCFETEVAIFQLEIKNESTHSIITTQKEIIIPLLSLNNSLYPLSDRVIELSKSGLGRVVYENKSILIKNTTGIFKLNYSIPFNYTENPNQTFTKQESNYNLFSFPPDYDSMVLYTMLKSGYSNVSYFSTFTDFFIRTNAQKVFFNLDKGFNNIAIVTDVTGGIYLLDSYNILILSENITLSNYIKDALESYGNKARIFVVDQNPKYTYPLNC